MSDDADILLKFYFEEREQARKTEEQRSTVTNLVLVIASAALGIIAQKSLTIDMLPLSLLLVALGVYGAIASEKFYERHQFHIGRTAFYRKRFVKLKPDIQLEECRKEAYDEHLKNFPRLHKIRLHYIWLALHLAISILGLVLTFVILA